MNFTQFLRFSHILLVCVGNVNKSGNFEEVHLYWLVSLE